jgi:hypothetical protein
MNPKLLVFVSAIILCAAIIVLPIILTSKAKSNSTERTIIQIVNPVPSHYEVLEEIIHQAPRIVKLPSDIEYDIHLYIIKNLSFEKYIRETYPRVRIHYNFNYMITGTNCYTIFATILDRFVLRKNNPKKFFLLHRYDKKYSTWENIYGLAAYFVPSRRLSITHLPFVNVKKHETPIPLFAVQGNLNHNYRRSWNLLVNIFRKKWRYEFKVKLIGRGKLPAVLKPYKENIILCNNLNFIDYHREFLDVYCLILPNTPESTPAYFGPKLTSSISYLQSYNIHGLLHEKLFQVSPTLESVTTFSSNENFLVAFEEVLNSFYLNRQARTYIDQ